MRPVRQPRPIRSIFNMSRLYNIVVLIPRPCAQQPWTICAQSVSPAQYGPSSICRDGRDDAAVGPSFGRPYAKHTRTELPFTRLPCSSFSHALLGPLDLRRNFQQQMGDIFIYILFCIRPIYLNVLGYPSHVLQRCHPACGHEASSYLTLFATEAIIKT